MDLVAVLALTIVLVDYARTGVARRLVALPVVALAVGEPPWLGGAGRAAGRASSSGRPGWSLGERLATWPARPKRPLLLAGLAAVLALCREPGRVRPCSPTRSMPTVASAFERAIAEWAPPDLSAPGLLVFRLTLAAAVIALALPARRPATRSSSSMAAAWTMLALGSARFVLIAGPLLVVAIGPLLRAPAASAAGDRRRTPLGRAASPSIARGERRWPSWPSSPWARRSSRRARRRGSTPAAFPVDATARLDAADCRGRLLNAYDWGGYLLRHTDRAVGAYGNSPGDIVATQADLEALRVDPRPFLETRTSRSRCSRPTRPLAAWFRSATAGASPSTTARRSSPSATASRLSDPVGPVHAEDHHDDADRDEDLPDRLEPAAVDDRQPAQADDERHRVEEVAVAVLQPPAAVVQQRRDEDEDRRAATAGGPRAIAGRRGTRGAAPGS